MSRHGRNKLYWQGQDIAPYLYGNAVRVIAPAREAPGKSDLEILRRAVSECDGRYGVRLSPITRPSELKEGNLILTLECARDALVKTLIRITRITTTDGRRKIHALGVWPGYYEHAGSFFREECALEVHESWGPTGERLMLHYHGPLPRSDKEPSFFERMQAYASDLSVLIECWAIATKPEILDKSYLSGDPYIGNWRVGFEQRHGRGFQHDLVWETLQQVQQENSLRGINRIFDSDRGGMGYRQRNLIDPLLQQMQDDILEVLATNEQLARRLFSEEKSSYWRKHLAVVIERYYARALTAVPTPRTRQPIMVDVRLQRKLTILRALIERPGTPAEGEVARAAYDRLMQRAKEI